MSAILLKAIFAALLCVPVAIVAGRLIIRLMDEYIKINKEKKELKEREKKALEQRKKRRGLY